MAKSRFGFLFVCCLMFTGCETKNVTIKGKLLKNGEPMIVSKETYVTISFIPDGDDPSKGTSRSATFDQNTGTYSIDLKPGKYRTMIVVSVPSKVEGKLSGPRPVKTDTVYELTKSQDLDLSLPDGK